MNILLQGYISNAYVEDFALVSDTAYAAQVCSQWTLAIKDQTSDFSPERWSHRSSASGNCHEQKMGERDGRSDGDK